MNRTVPFLLSAIMLCSCASWPGRRYPEVRAYAYNLKEGFPERIIQNGKLGKTVTSKTGVLLTPQQTQRLIAAVTGKHPSHPHAACFHPRHAFVFYDAAHTPGATLEVCFECLNNRSEPNGISGDSDFPALTELCTELRLPSSPGRDFRKGFDEFRHSFDKPQPTDTGSVPGIPGLAPAPKPQ